jgi:hypothetical protein
MITDQSLFDDIDENAEAAADAEGIADIAAGRTIPHEDVKAWLATWGTPAETPAPAHWFESSGRDARSPILSPSAPTSRNPVLWPRNAWRNG